MTKTKEDINEIYRQINSVSELSDEKVDEIYNTINDTEQDMQDNPYYYFKPLDTQKKFMDCEVQNKWLFGGNQSGKTTTGAAWVIEKCLEIPNSHWWCGAETWELSRLVQQAKMDELLPRDDVEYAHYNPETGFRHGTIKFKNGSTISFRSYDQERKRWQGATLHGIWFDEEPPWDIYQEALARVVKEDGWVIGTMTSLTGYTRLVEEVIMSKSSKCKCFFISTYDNVIEKGGALSLKAIERLEDAIDEKDRKSRLQGIPTPKTGLIFERLRKDEPYMVPFNKEFEPNAKFPAFVSIDPHPKTPHAVLWLQVDMAGHVWVIKERPWLLKVGSMERAAWATPKELVKDINFGNRNLKIEQQLIDKHACNQSNFLTASNIRDELIKEGLYTIEAGGDVEAKIVITQQMFREGRLHIFESCWNLWWELVRYVWAPHISSKVAGRKEEKQNPMKKNDHLIDCLMNALLYIRQTDFRVADTVDIQRNPNGESVLDENEMYRNHNYDKQFDGSIMEMYQ